MKKRFVGIFVLLCIVLGMVCSFPVAAFAAGNTWEDYKDTSIFADKNQMEYVINTPEQLAGFAYIVNTIQDSFLHKTVKLGNDIDLSGHDWIPIDYSGVKIRPAAGFWGTFDGNGKTISNMTIKSDSPSSYGTLVEVGFFGRCDGVMKNLKLTNIDITSSADVVGGICGALTTYSKEIDAKVENCSVDGNITSNAYYQNADVGRVYRATVINVNANVTMAREKLWSHWADTTKFETSQLEYFISTPEELAGFAKMLNGGESFAGKTVTLLNSIDLSKWEWVPGKDFKGTFNGAGHAIFGMKITPEFATRDAGFFASSSGYIVNLAISGDIDIYGSTASNAGMISATSSATILNCYTYGTIKNYSSNNSINTGGLVGFYKGGNEIKDCINAVDVTASKGYASYIGGLIGNWQTDNAVKKDVRLYRCANVGDITGGAYAGGLVGAITYEFTPVIIYEKKMLIMDCAVSDEVVIADSSEYTGGFVGRLLPQEILDTAPKNGKETVQIANSYCTATIKNPGRKGAGIIGYIDWSWTPNSSFLSNTTVQLSNIYSMPTLNNVRTYCYFATIDEDANTISVSTFKNFVVCYPFDDPELYAPTTTNGSTPTYNEAAYKRDTLYYFPGTNQYAMADYPKTKNPLTEGSLGTALLNGSRQSEITSLISGDTPSGWEVLSGFNKGYPILKDVNLKDFHEKLYSVSKATISGDQHASLDITPYNDLQQQLTVDKETGFMLRVERMFENKENRNADATSFESIEFTVPLPEGTKVTLRKIKSDFSGYEDGEYTTKVTGNATRKIEFNSLTKGGSALGRLPQSKEKTAYDVFFEFENTSFLDYETTYTVTVAGKTVPGTGTGEKIQVKDLPKSNVTFEYDENAGAVTILGDTTVISPNLSVKVLDGTTASFFIVPQISHSIKEITKNGTPVLLPSGGQIDIENISTDTTVKITFEKRMYDVTLDAASAGAQTNLTLPARVEYGDTLDFKVSAKDGYTENPPVTVKANGNVLTANTDGEYSLADITQNTVLSIEGFADVKPTVNTVAPSGADAALSGTITVAFSEDMKSGFGQVQLNDLPALGSGSWTDTRTYTASYTGLAPNASYTVNVSDFRDLTDNIMDKDSTHSFTTGKATPAVALDIQTDASQAPPVIILTANITGGFFPTGTVTFYEDNVPIGDPVNVTADTAAMTHSPASAEVEYTYHAVYDGDTNHEAATAAQKPYTINKSDGEITIKNDISKVYDGAPADAPATEQNSTGVVTIEYSADGINFTTTSPTEAGSYTVRATLAPDELFNGAQVSQSFEITQADPVYAAPSYFLAIEGTKLGDIDLSPYHANGTFEWKTPEADVGAVGSKTDFELQFIPDTKNYKRAEGIMVSVEVRRKSITPTAQSSTIGGVKGNYAAGETITFTATGSGMDNTAPLAGDTRWKPASWQCNPEGVFADGNDTASFVLNTAGNYELAVTFEEEIYDGTSFKATGSTYTEKIPILVNAGQTGRKAAATDDNAPLLTYSLLVLFSATLLVVVRANKKRPE